MRHLTISNIRSYYDYLVGPGSGSLTMTSFHTYGPTCKLRPYSDSTNQGEFRESGQVPKLKAHFFYNSLLPIDDPLSPLPTLSTNQASTNAKTPPRPFSSYDNAALEEAWQGLQAWGDLDASTNKRTLAKLETSTDITVDKRVHYGTANTSSKVAPINHPRRLMQVNSKVENTKSAVSLSQVEEASEADKNKLDKEVITNIRTGQDGLSSIQYISRPLDTTGTPFARTPNLRPEASFQQDPVLEPSIQAFGKEHNRAQKYTSLQGLQTVELDQDGEVHTSTLRDRGKQSIRHEGIEARVPVGLSRLHLVEMPELQVYLLLLKHRYDKLIKSDETNILEPCA